MRHDQALGAALAALAHTRQQLRAELLPVEAPAPAGNSHLPRPLAAWLRFGRMWLRRSALWAKVAPLHDMATPFVKRYPWPTIIAAAGAGALLIAARPWRWPLIAQPLLMLRRQATAWLLAQATSAAGQALVSSLFTRPPPRPRHAPESAAPPPSQQP